MINTKLQMVPNKKYHLHDFHSKQIKLTTKSWFSSSNKDEKILY